MRIRIAAAGVSISSLLLACPALAQPIAAASRIDAVTVYPDAASITRVAEFDVPKGASTLLFQGLPIGVDVASLRIAGQAPFALVIGSVESRVVAADKARPENGFEAKLQDLKDQREMLQVKRDALESRKAMIVRFSQAGPEKLSPEAKPLEIDKWSSAWDAVGAAMQKVGDELRTANRQAALLDSQIDTLTNAAVRPVQTRGPARDVSVLVDAGDAGKARLRLTYRIVGASWHPVYDARLSTGGQDKHPALELVRRAAIVQQTGEDWGEVALSVSTVRTDRGTAAPDMQPLKIAFADPVLVFESRSRSAKPHMKMRSYLPASPAARSAAGMDAAEPAAAPAPMPVVEAKATLDTGSYQATYAIGGRVSVPADGSEKSFQLGSKTFEPTLSEKTAPALDPTAYLNASFENTDNAPLLPGEIALVRDGTYVGKGALKLVAPGDKVNLGFGADDQVKVTRVPVRRRENDPVFIGSTKIEISEFKTLVKNLHAFPVKVTLVDQIPFSEITTLIVDKLPATTPPTESVVGDKRGVMAWNFDLAAGASKELHLAWRVRWPADSDVVLANAPADAK